MASMHLILFIILFQLKPVYLFNSDPFKNNDLLQNLEYEYIAEWQWEGRPVKQGSTELWPNLKINPSLWQSSSSWFAWENSNIWKYSTESREWSRIYSPSSTQTLDTISNQLQNVILCGLELPKTPKKQIQYDDRDEVQTKRRKKPKNSKELVKKLAVYTPFQGRSNKVWQINLANKCWTSYMCCCDPVLNTANDSMENVTVDVQEAINRTSTIHVFEDIQLFDEPTEMPEKFKSVNCPEFYNKTIGWCNNVNTSIEAVDLSQTTLTLWSYDLAKIHWKPKKLKIENDTIWPGCLKNEPIRFFGFGTEVFIFCNKIKSNPSNKKQIYCINTITQTLHDMGTIELDQFFSTKEGNLIWNSETQSVLGIAKTENHTVLVFAYYNQTNMWLLLSRETNFKKVEIMWRGSAAKWMSQYNSPFYNLAVGLDGKNVVGLFLKNPRDISDKDFWPRERGRFIIRIIKIDRPHDTRPREQNLTYDLLKSDRLSETKISDQTYNVKVSLFFGLSLAIFTTFGIILFFRRCVNYTGRVVRYQKPPVVRYTAIPHEVMYPIT